MKRLTLLIVTLLLTSACTRAASTPAPTDLPVNFPTPAPGSIAECQPADLQTSSNSSQSDGAVILGITLTNQTRQTCKLSNPAQVSLLTADGQPIDTRNTENTEIQTTPAPALTLLAPTESAILTVIWANFCQTLPGNDLTVYLGLSEKQNLEFKLKLPAAPTCATREKDSSLMVLPYSDPP